MAAVAYLLLSCVPVLLDERKREYRGKMKVIGRTIGQLLVVTYALLKVHVDTLTGLAEGVEARRPSYTT